MFPIQLWQAGIGLAGRLGLGIWKQAFYLCSAHELACGIPLRSKRRDREVDSEAHCPKGRLPAVAGLIVIT
jgi:hypothetical protein